MEIALKDLLTPRSEKVEPTSRKCPFIGLEHISSYTGELLGYGSTADVKSTVALFSENDILYGRLRPYLNKVIVAPFDGAASSEFIVFRGDDDRYDPGFIRFVLRSKRFVEFATSLNRGDRPRVKWEQLANYTIIAPKTREEQKKIADRISGLLDAAGGAHQNIARARALATRYRAAVVKTAFAEVSCEWKQLGSVVTNYDGRRIPVKRDDRELRRGAYPYYGASGQIDTIDDYIFDGSYLLVSEDGANLLARTSPIAFLASGRFWVNNHAHVLGEPSAVDLRLLSYFLETLDLSPIVTGTAQPKLTQKALSSIKVPYMRPSVQQTVLKKIENSLAVDKTISAEIERARKLLRQLEGLVLDSALYGEQF